MAKTKRSTALTRPGVPFRQPSGLARSWPMARPPNFELKGADLIAPGRRPFRLGFEPADFYRARRFWPSPALTSLAPIPPPPGPENSQFRDAFIQNQRAGGPR